MRFYWWNNCKGEETQREIERGKWYNKDSYKEDLNVFKPESHKTEVFPVHSQLTFFVFLSEQYSLLPITNKRFYSVFLSFILSQYLLYFFPIISSQMNSNTEWRKSNKMRLLGNLFSVFFLIQISELTDLLIPLNMIPHTFVKIE